MTILFVPMTPRRWALLAAIAEFVDLHPYGPSVRDLQLMCNVPSPSTVVYNLDKLERAGLIVREREIARALNITGLGREALNERHSKEAR